MHNLTARIVKVDAKKAFKRFPRENITQPNMKRAVRNIFKAAAGVAAARACRRQPQAGQWSRNSTEIRFCFAERTHQERFVRKQLAAWPAGNETTTTNK
jgi:hypothetical protein